MTAVIRGEHSLIEILSLEGCNVVYTGHQMTAILTTDSPALVVYSNLVFFFHQKEVDTLVQISSTSFYYGSNTLL